MTDLNYEIEIIAILTMAICFTITISLFVSCTKRNDDNLTKIKIERIKNGCKNAEENNQ